MERKEGKEEMGEGRCATEEKGGNEKERGRGGKRRRKDEGKVEGRRKVPCYYFYFLSLRGF